MIIIISIYIKRLITRCEHVFERTIFSNLTHISHIINEIGLVYTKLYRYVLFLGIIIRSNNFVSLVHNMHNVVFLINRHGGAHDDTYEKLFFFLNESMLRGTSSELPH